MPPKVACIVLSYNDAASTVSCLESLQQQSYRPLEILVVDSASQDETVPILRERFPQIGLIASPKNLGYAAGNNLGMKTALENGAEVLFLVNNDTWLERDCVARLVEALQVPHPRGIVGPMVYTFDEGRTISSAGGEINWHKADSYNMGIGQYDHGQFPARPVDFINGCGLMITRQAIQRAGMLDERYFMYWEETDWCVRVRRAGLEVSFHPEAQMRHKAPITAKELSPTTTYYMARNRILFFATHTPWQQKPLTLAHALNGILRGIFHTRRAGQLQQAKATQLALLHALQRRWGQTDPALWK